MINSTLTALKNKRGPKDYMRRWPILRRSFLRTDNDCTVKQAKKYLRQLKKTQSDQLVQRTLSNDKFPSKFSYSGLLIRILKDKGLLDESEITWNQIDRSLSLPPG